MHVREIMMARQSCRAFDSRRAVPQEELEACLQAARIAPSACNSQPWQYTVCTGVLAGQVAPLLVGPNGMNAFAADAPCLIVVSEAAYNLSAGVGSKVKGQDYRSIDIGISVSYLTLAATEQGLASCIMGWFDEKRLQKLLGIRSRIRLVIALGYAAPGDRHRIKERKKMEEIARFVSEGANREQPEKTE